MYFLDEVILPPGEKIRRIRSYLGLKQYEITGGKVTRNLISYIENGKTKLVRDTAAIIVESMNELAEKKKIPLNIDVEYLMRDETAQAKLLLERYLNNLKKYIKAENEEFENELNKAKNIFRNWDITDKKAEIYELAGDYYYEKQQFSESHINYLKSLECYIRSSNHLKTAELYMKLGRCANWLKNYQESINLNNYALAILENGDSSKEYIGKRVLFNNALSYKKLGLFDEALSSLEELESEMGDKLTESQYCDILLLKGNCYFQKQNYSIAKKIFEQIVDITKNNGNQEFLALTYMNLSELYLKTNEEEKSIEYINDSLKIRINTNYEYLEEIYIELGKRYRDIKKYDLSEKYLMKALKETNIKEKRHFQIDIYEELLYSYIYWKKDSRIDELIKNVKKIFDNKDCRGNEAKNVFFKAAHYYIEKDIEKSKELLEFGLNIESS
ncbi:tetratricopeptide repeat protein [Wukongibacter baidiensis]|uniref:tetratricopeptide repeat protein n=1 Tax=Wukongibacter baidiensis TaxID=1723361 RepID=UPI003D7F60EE